jgi:hypothetical protein
VSRLLSPAWPISSYSIAPLWNPSDRGLLIKYETRSSRRGMTKNPGGSLTWVLFFALGASVMRFGRTLSATFKRVATWAHPFPVQASELLRP